MRLAPYLLDWIDRKERLRSVRTNTIKGYRADYKHVEAAIGKVRLDQLGEDNIEYLWAYLLDRDLKIAHCRRTLNAALNDAVRRGLMVRNPLPAADAPTEQETEIEPYVIEQMAALLEAAAGSRNAPRWTLALALGLRQGEALGLCWDDVNLSNRETDEGTLVIRRQLQRVPWRHGCPDPARCINRAGKPAKRAADCLQRWGGGLKVSEPKSRASRRSISLPATLVLELRAHRLAQKREQVASEIWEEGPNGGWVFANEIGRPLDARADWEAFRVLCETAGIPPKRLHDLRHSAATMMLESELDLRTAGSLLGHSQLALTARYSHILADRRSVAAGRIEQALFGQPTDDEGVAAVRRRRRTATKTATKISPVSADGAKGLLRGSPRPASNRRPDAYKTPPPST